jgi:hypothetical protein
MGIGKGLCGGSLAPDEDSFWPTFQKPCIPDSRSLGNEQFKAKLLRPFGQRSDLLLAIPGFVVFGPFINVGVSVFDEPVEQAG